MLIEAELILVMIAGVSCVVYHTAVSPPAASRLSGVSLVSRAAMVLGLGQVELLPALLPFTAK